MPLNKAPTRRATRASLAVAVSLSAIFAVSFNSMASSAPPSTDPAEPTEPPATEPPVTEPTTTTTEPPTTTTEPPTTAPPVTEPPVTEPPVTEPPVTEPPVTEPPVTEPPVTEPPATEPPTTEPATSTTSTTSTTTSTTTTTVPLLADGNVTRDIQFPVIGGHSFGSGWNDPRDDGARYHHGVDVLASPGQPVISPVSGRVVSVLRGHPTANNGIVVADAEGYEWHLYHLSPDFPGSLGPGSAVTAGQLVGFVGSDQAIPHVHAELHQPDGTPINSLWSLQAGRSGNLPCADMTLDVLEWREVSGLVVSPDNTSYMAIDTSLCSADTVTELVFP